jgi:hypothetical protein
MTPPPTQTPTCQLDDATRATLLRSVFRALPHLLNATEAEKTGEREAAFALIIALNPRDPVEAMLVARLVVAHYALMDAYRSAARSDITAILHLRYQGKAIALSRLTNALMRELKKSQAGPALPATLPASVPAPRAQQAPVATPDAPVSQAAPASQPATASAGHQQASAAAPRPATGGFVPPTAAEIDLLVAAAEARLEAASALLAA